jgi:tRNA(Ile)-lysidine synthase
VRAAEPFGPVEDRELNELFAPIAGASTVALAVSGGADSLALLHLFARWRRDRRRPRGIVFSVDHRLRSGSRREAEYVVATAVAYGLEGKVLAARGAKPVADIEAAARAVRYRLLLAATREAGASHLLLAHHEDDQAETLLLRIARGSGVFGLASMRAAIVVGDDDRGLVTILRPFLGLPRARLAATCARAGLDPVADPMNADPRFARARLRRIMPLLAADGLEPAQLAATARRLGSAADALDAVATRFLADHVACDDLGIAQVDPSALSKVPGEVLLRVIARIVLAIGGEDYPPRFERLASLVDALGAFDGSRRFKRTLGGAVAEWRSGRIFFYRESGRDGLEALPLNLGGSILWDRRFRVTVDRGAAKGLHLGPLGEAGRRQVGAGDGILPAGALVASPAIWRRERLISAPLLGFGREAVAGLEMRSILAERLAAPPRFPDFGA